MPPRSATPARPAGRPVRPSRFPPAGSAAPPTALPRHDAEAVRAARVAAGLTQAQAAQLVHLGSRERWTEYEAGIRTIDPARWELFLLRAGQHPDLRVVRKARAASPQSAAG
mgnify:CR=1 FL=1